MNVSVDHEMEMSEEIRMLSLIRCPEIVRYFGADVRDGTLKVSPAPACLICMYFEPSC